MSDYDARFMQSCRIESASSECPMCQAHEQDIRNKAGEIRLLKDSVRELVAECDELDIGRLMWCGESEKWKRRFFMLFTAIGVLAAIVLYSFTGGR